MLHRDTGERYKLLSQTAIQVAKLLLTIFTALPTVG